MKPTVYPETSDILERKAEGRKALSRLSFVEKVERMEALREALGPFARRRLAANPVRDEDFALIEPKPGIPGTG